MNKLLVLAVLCAFAMPLEAKSDKSDKSKKSGKSGNKALIKEVKRLKQMVADLKVDVAELQSANEDPYSGEYFTTVYETSVFGCGNTISPPLGTPEMGPYLQSQAVSSITTRSADAVSTADGVNLFISEYTLLNQELRLSGQYEERTNIDGGLYLDIRADGSLWFDAGPDVSVTGQMSDDGSTFSIIAQGRLEEDGCDDAFSVVFTGNRR